LARNEPAEVARREGVADGERIVKGFSEHPYISNLARNPLMLSAICLVNYFESGELPKDRALLYRLCVEGLLHHWDQRRGIRSEFTLEEKLLVCRELALAMWVDDRAEYGIDKVREIFSQVILDTDRSKELLEHIRYRSGLLLEKRHGVFGFAHLTFQEYLVALAIFEGNRQGVDAARLVRQHGNARWGEVTALYCGLGPPAARSMIELLIAQPDTRSLSTILSEAYLSAAPELLKDYHLRRRVLKRIAVSPIRTYESAGALDKFAGQDIPRVSNEFLGKTRNTLNVSEAYHWLRRNPSALNAALQVRKLREWRKLTANGLGEIVSIAHINISEELLRVFLSEGNIYESRGPLLEEGMVSSSQAEVALLGFGGSEYLCEGSMLVDSKSALADSALLRILKVISIQTEIIPFTLLTLAVFLGKDQRNKLPSNTLSWLEFASTLENLAKRVGGLHPEGTPSLLSHFEVASNLTTLARKLRRAAAG
jgi:hypothetical protein